MTKAPARPRWTRPADFTTATDERKMLILDALRKSLVPMTRRELTAALGWPDNILSNNVNKSIDPIMLLMEEGKVGRTQKGREVRYFPDPDISKMIVRK